MSVHTIEIDRSNLDVVTANLAPIQRLPLEIRALIWKHAFAGVHMPTYASRYAEQHSLYDHFYRVCDTCKDKSLPASRNSASRTYNDAFAALLTCRTIYDEAQLLFKESMTLHIKDPEAIALIRNITTLSFRSSIKKLVLYIHFNHDNHLLWCMRLFELQAAFRNITHVSVEYHMRPPSSYNNVLDVVLFYMPLLELSSNLSPPRYVLTSRDRPESTFRLVEKPVQALVPCTSQEPGLVIHTSYMVNEPLFQAEFLGEVWTEDAIDEHTGVVRDLFHNASFIATAHQVVSSNRESIDEWVSAAHEPGNAPQQFLQSGFPDKTHMPVLHQALLMVARNHERPFFEKLQRRRVIGIYCEQGRMTRDEAERLLQRQLDSLPAGQTIEDFIERLMNHDIPFPQDAEPINVPWPASWQSDGESD